MKFIAWMHSAWRMPLALMLLLTLVGCNSAGRSTPLPTVVLGGDSSPQTAEGEAATSTSPQGGSLVVASGIAVPALDATLAFAASGNVQAISVTVGDRVEAGQVLALLDTGEATLAVQQAEADVATAQVNYDLAQATGPAKYAAALAAAQLALEQAQNGLETLQQNAPLETAQARLALVKAQAALDDAQKKRNELYYARSSQFAIDDAQARYDEMKKALDQAEAAYDQVKDLPTSDPARGQAMEDLNKAQQDFDDALTNLNWYQGYNGQQLAAADAQVTLARAQLDAAQRRWAEVKDGPSAVAFSLAEAQVASSQAQWDLANAQSVENDLTLAQAQLDAARARLSLAQAQLARRAIVAPFSGVVAAVQLGAGEWATMGQPVLVVADLSHLRVETTDLSEQDVPEVAVGQPVTVFFKALNQEVSGHVLTISPLADTLGGDIVYKTTIELEALPTGLRAGMKAEVRFGPGK